MKQPINDLPGFGNQTNQLLRFANDIILLMDQNGKLLDANEAAVKIYGWSLDELLTMNVSELRDPDTLKDLVGHLKMTAQTGALFETRHKHRDGTTFPVEVSTRNFEYGGRYLRQSIIRDISRRYEMLAKMEYDARRIEGLLRLNEMATQLPEKEFMQFGLEWVEKLTGSKIAFIHFVNEDQLTIELVAWSAATRDHYCTVGFDNHYPVAQAGIWADCLRQLKPVVFNDYVNYPDKHGLPDGHSTLTRLVSVPVVEGELVRVILGVGNKDSEYDASDVEVATLFGNDMWRIIRRLRVEAELKANLEAQRILIRKLEEAQNQLLQSEKMASLGQLAAGVAHELNNPIGFVNSNMGTLEKYLQDIFAIESAYEQAAETAGNNCSALSEVNKLKQEKDFDYIKQDVFQLMSQSRDGLARMRKIVQDLKDFSHVGEQGWSWADLHKCLDSTLNIVWNELKYKCEVIKAYGSLPEVFCIPSQINQVLLNLLVNAGQSIESKGKITIQTRVEDDEVWVEISDTGKGIPAQNIKRIFEPFFTTKPVGLGTGLGLSLSYSIVQKHHGRIEVESEVGQGTTMRLCLPINSKQTLN